MRFAVDELEFDTFTIVDSDQLLLRRGYTRHIERFLSQHSGAGCLVSQPGPQPPTTRIEPARAAWQEIDLWRPFLRKFPGGESTFPQWTFWPSTVFTEHAARDLLALWRDDGLQEILGRTRIWASEEVILPSLVALSGHEIVGNPCAYDLVQYRMCFSPDQLEAAMGRDDVFWVHPIPRKIDDPLRTLVRYRYCHYDAATSSATPRRFPRTLDLINRMESVEGWLSRTEADLLAAAAVRALSELPAPHTVVEVGSYCGRATVLLGSVAQAVRPGSKLHTFDPHDGTQGERDHLVRGQPASHCRLLSNIEQFGVTDVVRPIVTSSTDVEWTDPISLLVIDRLHDYASVATDFAQFQAHLVVGGLVAFHDYADYFPGVRAWVDQLKTSGTYTPVDQVESMMIMEKTRSLPLPPIGAIVEKAGSVHGLLGADEAALLFLAAARALAECDHGKVVSTGIPMTCRRRFYRLRRQPQVGMERATIPTT
jgi:Methyltransferase domain